jgi:DNA-binding IclR family transcriptional regulator
VAAVLSEAATLGAVAKRSALSASQAHRYLASLIASGMAHQNPSSGRYDLGPQAIQIGVAALARTDVFAEADPSRHSPGARRWSRPAGQSVRPSCDGMPDVRR